MEEFHRFLSDQPENYLNRHLIEQCHESVAANLEEIQTSQLPQSQISDLMKMDADAFCAADGPVRAQLISTESGTSPAELLLWLDKRLGSTAINGLKNQLLHHWFSSSSAPQLQEPLLMGVAQQRGMSFINPRIFVFGGFAVVVVAVAAALLTARQDAHVTDIIKAEVQGNTTTWSDGGVALNAELAGLILQASAEVAASMEGVTAETAATKADELDEAAAAAAAGADVESRQAVNQVAGVGSYLSQKGYGDSDTYLETAATDLDAMTELGNRLGVDAATAAARLRQLDPETIKAASVLFGWEAEGGTVDEHDAWITAGEQIETARQHVERAEQWRQMGQQAADGAAAIRQQYGVVAGTGAPKEQRWIDALYKLRDQQ